MTLLATCPPGLEPVLQAEVGQLPGLAAAAAVTGGVELHGEPSLVGAANLHLRSANRVLLRLGRFRAVRFGQLLDAVAALPWERYLVSADVQVHVTCRRCRLYHSGAVAERVVQGVAARLGRRGTGSGGPRVLLRGQEDLWEVSLDTSGELLHRRGYRQEVGPAPLRETLAAALLLFSGYQGGPVLDLCTGTGTLAIEAALMRCQVAPGLWRRFACQDWPVWEAAAWDRLRQQALARIRPEQGPAAVLGLDLDPVAVARAQTHAIRAGVAGTTLFRQADLFQASAYADFRATWAGAPLLVVANPPYGRRLGRRDEVVAFHRRLGRLLRGELAGSSVLILCGHRHGAAALNLAPPALRVQSGGLPLQIVCIRAW
ncbi:MAG: RNA methyltransferase [Myxococcales bacterium]|nr:RNA methyltransferase [Myxococcales bacterium]